ncbi:MAG: hypothetical protein K2O24_03665 [Muribaculaceae bacterium]|nr:hypothetical protein [Muribaculaceae bacterium]
MAQEKHLYIVSFGDSRKYRMMYDGDRAERSPLLTEVESQLNDYLKQEFPEDSYTYYTTPRIVPIEWSDREEYMDYPELDAKAIEEIKKVLAHEIRDMNAINRLDRNAPYADAPLD